MATYGRVYHRTMQAGADLRTNLYTVLRQQAAGICNVASNPGGGFKEVVGILWNKPNSGGAATVAIQGEAKVLASGVIAVGTMLSPNGSGRAQAANSGDFTFGQALEAAASNGDIIRCLIRMPAVQLPSSTNV